MFETEVKDLSELPDRVTIMRAMTVRAVKSNMLWHPRIVLLLRILLGLYIGLVGLLLAVGIGLILLGGESKFDAKSLSLIGLGALMLPFAYYLPNLLFRYQIALLRMSANLMLNATRKLIPGKVRIELQPEAFLLTWNGKKTQRFPWKKFRYTARSGTFMLLADLGKFSKPLLLRMQDDFEDAVLARCAELELEMLDMDEFLGFEGFPPTLDDVKRLSER